MSQPDKQKRTTFDNLLAPPDVEYSSGKTAALSSVPQRGQRNTIILAVLSILLAAALFILLMSYFNQRRDYEAQIADLTNAFHAVQADNDELEAQNTALQNRFDNLKETSQAKLDEVEDDLHDMLIEKYLLVTAWYADVLFQRGDYNECASVMRFIYNPGPNYDAVEGHDAIFYVNQPDSASVIFNSNVRLRYIRDELIRLDYLKEGEIIISDALGESGIAGENARTDTEEVTTYNNRYLTFP